MSVLKEWFFCYYIEIKDLLRMTDMIHESCVCSGFLGYFNLNTQAL